ncbi:hypothetical protein [Dactylosporangium sp. NPDC050588]|uniref:hypothetical protein n=1 Tax=Dactylosporangium sp. NPDC050588 TaxID=3157211 RepID=UPI0033FA188A
MALQARARRIAAALVILPLLLGCGCCEGAGVAADSVFGGSRKPFTEQDVIGDWSSDCDGTISIRADGTATVKQLPYREDSDGVETKADGELTWKIAAADKSHDQEVQFVNNGTVEFSAHAERTWGDFEHLEYYKTRPSDPIYCVLSKQ